MSNIDYFNQNEVARLCQVMPIEALAEAVRDVKKNHPSFYDVVNSVFNSRLAQMSESELFNLSRYLSDNRTTGQPLPSPTQKNDFLSLKVPVFIDPTMGGVGGGGEDNTEILESFDYLESLKSQQASTQAWRKAYFIARKQVWNTLLIGLAFGACLGSAAAYYFLEVAK